MIIGLVEFTLHYDFHHLFSLILLLSTMKVYKRHPFILGTHCSILYFQQAFQCCMDYIQNQWIYKEKIKPQEKKRISIYFGFKKFIIKYFFIPVCLVQNNHRHHKTFILMHRQYIYLYQCLYNCKLGTIFDTL